MDEQGWGKQAIISMFFWDLSNEDRQKVSFLYDIIGIPKLPDCTYSKIDICKGCKISDPVFRYFINNLKIPVQEIYRLDSAYSIVYTIRKLGIKRLNAKKSRIKRSKEAHAISDSNFQKGTT